MRLRHQLAAEDMSDQPWRDLDHSYTCLLMTVCLIRVKQLNPASTWQNHDKWPLSSYKTKCHWWLMTWCDYLTYLYILYNDPHRPSQMLSPKDLVSPKIYFNQNLLIVTEKGLAEVEFKCWFPGQQNVWQIVMFPAVIVITSFTLISFFWCKTASYNRSTWWLSGIMAPNWSDSAF